MADVRSPQPTQLGGADLTLASDRERDRLVERLSAACADGRLDLAAFSDRLEAALVAKTMAEVHALEADLGHPPAAVTAPSASGRVAWLVAVMSQTVRRGSWVLQPRSRALAVMGECVLDLRNAEVLASSSQLTAVALMGSVRVIVPPGIDVDLEGLAVMGTKTLKGSSARPLPGSPSIRVTAYALMGEVSVVTKPPKGESRLTPDIADRLERRLARIQEHGLRHQRRRLRHRGGWGDQEEGD
ncbi:MAG: DUF1707 SHOCT-like domain-containing protein [Candidatus Dormibacteria bacterium]